VKKERKERSRRWLLIRISIAHSASLHIPSSSSTSLHISSSCIPDGTKSRGIAGMRHQSIRKKKIASLASGRTRRSGHFRHHLLNSDADRHGTVRSDAVRHGICLPDRAWQGILVLDTRCQGIFLLDVAVSGHFPSGRSRVRAFSF